MKPWLVLVPLAVLVFLNRAPALTPVEDVIFLNRAPGHYAGHCDLVPITFEVDASGAIGVTCASIHATLTTSGGSVTCKERAR